MSEKKRCFVIGPIGDPASQERIHADWFYDGIVRPVLEPQDFQVERADKISQPGMISDQIINRLEADNLVIADLSFHNANAFYEMAIRHNVGKPIIHMIRMGERIPFDVMPHRAIPFSVAQHADLENAKIELASAVDAAIAPDFDAANPITHARGFKKAIETASPADKAVLEQLAALAAKVAELEQNTLGIGPRVFTPIVRHKTLLEVRTQGDQLPDRARLEAVAQVAKLHEYRITPAGPQAVLIEMTATKNTLNRFVQLLLLSGFIAREIPKPPGPGEL